MLGLYDDNKYIYGKQHKRLYMTKIVGGVLYVRVIRQIYVYEWKQHKRLCMTKIVGGVLYDRVI